MPNFIILLSSDRRLREMETFHEIRWDVGNRHPVRHVQRELLKVTERQPTNNTRSFADLTSTTNTSLDRIFKNRSWIPNIFRLCKSKHYTMRLQDFHFVNECLECAEDITLTVTFLSRTNRGALWNESPNFATKICTMIKTLIRYDRTSNSYNFPLLLGRNSVLLLDRPQFYGYKLAVSTTSDFFDHTDMDNWKPKLSIRAFMYGFNLTEFQNIKVIECVIGWQKIILPAGLFAGMKRQFLLLNSDLTWNL